MQISLPNEQISSSVVHAMTGEPVLSATRMATGDQNFVYAVKTSAAEYVLRMTDISHKHKFEAAIAWQKMLLPLGVPLAEFIKTDLDDKYSPFPALLMMRLPGDDLINVYSSLHDAEKKNLAIEMTKIQALCNKLPEGSNYGILDSYDSISAEKSWYEFLIKRLELYINHITKTGVFNPHMATQVLNILSNMEEHFRFIRPTPFLWDASERNVLIYKGKISGIVDVDELCFGDPLLVIALTSICLKLEGYDVRYTDYWAEALHLDKPAQTRLNFYKLFYTIAFMRKHSMETANSKKVIFDTKKLVNIFYSSLEESRLGLGP
jgi:hypothetical protein